MNDERVVEMALANMATLSGVYSIDRLDALEADLKRLGGEGRRTATLQGIRVNEGDGKSLEERLEQLRALGATKATFDRLDAMTRLDRIIWSRVAGDAATGDQRPRAAAPAPALA